jgi:hypothetical protein
MVSMVWSFSSTLISSSGRTGIGIPDHTMRRDGSIAHLQEVARRANRSFEDNGVPKCNPPRRAGFRNEERGTKSGAGVRHRRPTIARREFAVRGGLTVIGARLRAAAGDRVAQASWLWGRQASCLT